MSKHGGPRPGSGRPPLPGGARRLSVVLPQPMVRWLDRQPGRSRSEKLRRLLQHCIQKDDAFRKDDPGR